MEIATHIARIYGGVLFRVRETFFVKWEHHAYFVCYFVLFLYEIKVLSMTLMHVVEHVVFFIDEMRVVLV
jgi:hypothetical protein